MQIDAMTVFCFSPNHRQKIRICILLIGANQRMMRCSQFVGKEQIAPNKQSTKIARSTV